MRARDLLLTCVGASALACGGPSASSLDADAAPLGHRTEHALGWTAVYGRLASVPGGVAARLVLPVDLSELLEVRAVAVTVSELAPGAMRRDEQDLASFGCTSTAEPAGPGETVVTVSCPEDRLPRGFPSPVGMKLELRASLAQARGSLSLGGSAGARLEPRAWGWEAGVPIPAPILGIAGLRGFRRTSYGELEDLAALGCQVVLGAGLDRQSSHARVLCRDVDRPAWLRLGADEIELRWLRPGDDGLRVRPVSAAVSRDGNGGVAKASVARPLVEIRDFWVVRKVGEAAEAWTDACTEGCLVSALGVGAETRFTVDCRDARLSRPVDEDEILELMYTTAAPGADLDRGLYAPDARPADRAAPRL
jgi:hypothetical protein